VGCNSQVHERNARISLYSYLYLKLAKMLCLSYYRLRFLFNKTREQEIGTGSALKRDGRGGAGREGEGGGPNNVYTCK
jgi:hypothetical protein